MPTDLERQEQIKNDGEQVGHETVHIIGASVQKHQQIDVPAGISIGIDFDSKSGSRLAFCSLYFGGFLTSLQTRFKISASEPERLYLNIEMTGV